MNLELESSQVYRNTLWLIFCFSNYKNFGKILAFDLIVKDKIRYMTVVMLILY